MMIGCKTKMPPTVNERGGKVERIVVKKLRGGEETVYKHSGSEQNQSELFFFFIEKFKTIYVESSGRMESILVSRYRTPIQGPS